MIIILIYLTTSFSSELNNDENAFQSLARSMVLKNRYNIRQFLFENYRNYIMFSNQKHKQKNTKKTSIIIFLSELENKELQSKLEEIRSKSLEIESKIEIEE